MKTLYKSAFLGAFLFLLAACSQQQAPVGRWEGYLEDTDWIIAVRLQVNEGNTIYATALSLEVAGMSNAMRAENTETLLQTLPDQWKAAELGEIDFSDNILRRKGGVAPLFVYEPSDNTMTFHFFAGGKLTRRVYLRPVKSFTPTPGS
ncbi:MAG: hypothetical protein KJS87_03160 [Alphaproteobacteria bacterium]|nr:hypothetical protein [Alphaproteobacteria bacterium]